MLPNRETCVYSALSVDAILDNSETEFETFVNLGGQMVLYSGAGYKWYREELEKLLRSGFRQLFIRESDADLLGSYKMLSSLPKIVENLAPTDRIVKLEQVGAQFVKAMYNSDVTDGCIRKAEEVAQAVVGCIDEDPTCVRAIGSLADHDMYTYVHSIRVAIYSTAIAMIAGGRSTSCLAEITLGGIFHDIGKKLIPLEVLNKRGALTDLEWRLMRSHPEKGKACMENSRLPFVAQSIIQFHHEKLDGSGYPTGLTEQEIIPEVQFSTLADIFDALTSSRAYQQKRTRYQALDFIKNKLIGKEISAQAFKALVESLA